MSRKSPKQSKQSKQPRKLRSESWFGRGDRDALVHRSWMKNQGFPHDLFIGKPVIGICNTWSEVTPCNAHFRELAEHIKAGVLEAGGFPLEFPVMSTGEPVMRPTAMLYRNQVAMDVEESIRANPFDGVVLMMGCDKTTPALLMGAASVDLPTIGISGGPMLNGKFRGQDIGSGTMVWQVTEKLKTGEFTEEDMIEVESCQSRSAGHCMTMGTASTMASMVESLGMGLPTNAAIPAVDSRRKVLCRLVGRRIVEMVREDLRMSRILTKEALENAIMVNGAIGGSTNAVVHLLAIAGRLGVKLTLDDWDRLGRDMPCLVNLMPSGEYLMEDFYYAGGLPVVIRELGNGRTVEHQGANLCFPWAEASELDVWVAAYGPKALALTGEVGDGFILQLADPDIAAWTIDAVRIAASDAGRDPDAITFCVAAPAYVGDDIDHMRDQCRWFGGMVGNHVADIVARYGSSASIPTALTDYIKGREGYDYNEHGQAGNTHAEFVPDEIVDRFCLLGTASQHIARLEELRDLGVDQFAIYLQHDAKSATLESYGETIIPAMAASRLARS